MSQSDRQTDRQTDGRTDGLTERQVILTIVVHMVCQNKHFWQVIVKIDVWICPAYKE